MGEVGRRSLSVVAGVVLLAMALGVAGSAGAQPLDRRLFDAVYQIEEPVFEGAMRTADATSMPVFLGAVPAAWGGVWLIRGGGDWTDAYRLTLSEAGTLAATFALKALVGRTRPYVRYADVTSRGGDPARWDPWSFPSGHASLSFALATSVSLSHARWYVVVPAYLWAASVSVSRVWLGVHFPADVLVGALLGASVAWTVHRLGPSLTPDGLEPGETGAVPVFALRLLRF